MTDPIRELVRRADHSNPPLGKLGGNDVPVEPESQYQLLREILDVANGFHVFDGALHVRSTRPLLHGDHSLAEWNDAKMWRNAYGILAPHGLCFAEDLFGNQFILHECVLSFDCETAEVVPFAKDLHDWAARILDDPNDTTGFPLANAWKLQHGVLPYGYRLLGKLPFVLGGDYQMSNLYALQDIECMRFCASIALQIHGRPDGTSIELRVT